MTIFVEISRPFQVVPFAYKSDLMIRVGWLWFAVAVLRVPFKTFCLTLKVWRDK